MKNIILILSFLVILNLQANALEGPMELGQFSISLEVKDIKKSQKFYQKLGFTEIAGNVDQKWLILQNETNSTVIGLFQDEWQGFKLTFNPKDVRSIQKKLKQQGIKFEVEATGTSGPAHAELKDPDGHVILLDQHN